MSICSDNHVQQPPKRNKEKDRKKKRSKNSPQGPTQHIIPEGQIATDLSAIPGTSTGDSSKNNGSADYCFIGPKVLELAAPAGEGEDSVQGSTSPMITQTNEESENAPAAGKCTTPTPASVPMPQAITGQEPVIITQPPVTDEYALVKHYADLQSESMTPVDNDTAVSAKSMPSDKIVGPIEEGFCCVISMYDGVVLFTTPTITESLGFPKDMWLGRSFIDFVHPKDRHTFASQISSGVPFLEKQGGLCASKDSKNYLYVMLRKYRGLKNYGYGIAGNDVIYEPYKLVLNFREGPDAKQEETPAGDKRKLPYTSTMLLIISATPVTHFYKRECPDLPPSPSTFHLTLDFLSQIPMRCSIAVPDSPSDIIAQGSSHTWTEMPCLHLGTCPKR